jgi:3-oxoacyl-(acyl-carrier-protein) synthase
VPDGASVCTLVGYTPDGSHHLQESLLVEGFLERLEADAATREGIRTALRDAYPRWSADVTGYLPHVVARQAVAGLLPPGNEVLTVDTACSSSLYAMDIGMRELVSGRRDVVVCAGSFALAPTNSVLFAKLHGLSPSGEVRSLDRDCDGVLFSDGAAAVVLKRTCDALADGDPIVGYLVASGTSSDGKGKGIYAPNAYGQRLAVDRAYERSRIRPGDVDWVIAHATGTPAGDESELGALGEAFAGVDHPVHVTSNKSLVGHSGWAAGVVSVVNALLAIRHDTIPAQHRFRQGSHRLSAEGCTLVVPTTDVAWPARTERARCVAVSGFGFGGTNAHLVVSDRPAPEGPAPDDGSAGRGAAENAACDPAGDVVIVAWAGDFPGDDPAAVRRWLSGDRSAAPPTSFGPEYLWSPTAVRPKIPPRTLRTIDRCQHMIIRCAEQLRDTLGGAWVASAATAAVLVGHMGPTRNSALYALRCHLDDIEDSLLRSGVQTPAEGLAELRSRVQGEVRPSNEDSFPGIMPNVIPARVSNYFGLNGPNLTVDAGFASVLAAVHVGAQYLRHGGVGLALIGGSSGNSLQAMSTGASRLRGTPSEASEGTLLMALMRRADAERFELPVLATVVDGDDSPTARPPSSTSARPRARPSAPTWAPTVPSPSWPPCRVASAESCCAARTPIRPPSRCSSTSTCPRPARPRWRCRSPRTTIRSWTGTPARGSRNRDGRTRPRPSRCPPGASWSPTPPTWLYRS